MRTAVPIQWFPVPPARRSDVLPNGSDPGAYSRYDRAGSFHANISASAVGRGAFVRLGSRVPASGGYGAEGVLIVASM